MSLAILFHFLYVLNMFRAFIYPSSGACDYSVVSVLQASACNTDTTPTQLHLNSNTHRTKNNTTNVIIQQNSRKLLKMDIWMSETCWAHKKWNKIASDMKLFFYSLTMCIMLANNVDVTILMTVYLRMWYIAVRTGGCRREFHGIELSETMPKCFGMGN